MELSGKVVVVTGGASGIGAAMCRRFASESPAGMVVADLRDADAGVVAEEVGGIAVATDLGTPDGVQRVIAAAREEYGRIDLYCSNAGVAFGGGAEAGDAAWQASWEVNVLAGVRAARLLLPEWRERGEGYFLSTVSAAGLLNHVFAAPYAATKAAALSFAEHLAIAYADEGIRVSALCPQGVRTPMLESDPSGFLDRDAMEPEEVAEVVLDALREERFLVLPHPEVAEYSARRGQDHDRWIGGMQRLRRRILEFLAQQPGAGGDASRRGQGG